MLVDEPITVCDGDFDCNRGISRFRPAHRAMYRCQTICGSEVSGSEWERVEKEIPTDVIPIFTAAKASATANFAANYATANFAANYAAKAAPSFVNSRPAQPAGAPPPTKSYFTRSKAKETNAIISTTLDDDDDDENDDDDEEDSLHHAPEDLAYKDLANGNNSSSTCQT